MVRAAVACALIAVTLALGATYVMAEDRVDAKGVASQLDLKKKNALNDAMWSYRLGDSVKMIQQLSKIVSKFSADDLQTADQLLAEKKLPSVVELLAEARLAMILQGQAKKMPRMEVVEASYLLPVFQTRVNEALLEADSELLTKPLPPENTEFREFEVWFWKARALGNRLANAGKISEVGLKIKKKLPRKGPKHFTDAQQEALNIDFEGVTERVEELVEQLTHRSSEVRFNRFLKSSKVLAQPELTADRYYAAATWELDALNLTRYLKKSEQLRVPLVWVKERGLSEKQLGKQIVLAARKARKDAGQLTFKAQLLFEGFDWWFRGRYGRGTEAGGLAKNREALRNEHLAREVMLPIELPKPTPPGGVNHQDRYEREYSVQVPDYERRHYYTWAVEEGSVSRGVTSGALGKHRNKGSYFM